MGVQRLLGGLGLAAGLVLGQGCTTANSFVDAVAPGRGGRDSHESQERAAAAFNRPLDPGERAPQSLPNRIEAELMSRSPSLTASSPSPGLPEPTRRYLAAGPDFVR